jgi:hypothetical protein
LGIFLEDLETTEDSMNKDRYESNMLLSFESIILVVSTQKNETKPSSSALSSKSSKSDDYAYQLLSMWTTRRIGTFCKIMLQRNAFL